MTENCISTWDALRRAIEGWSADCNTPDITFPMGHRTEFMGAKTYLGIKTRDSAKTLHSIAAYMDAEGYARLAIRALFDERAEDIEDDGSRVLYWPELQAKAEDKGRCEEGNMNTDDLKQRAKEIWNQAARAVRKMIDAEEKSKDALALLEEARCMYANAYQETARIWDLAVDLHKAIACEQGRGEGVDAKPASGES